MFPGEYTLYGSKRSYFTAKVENILRFQGLPYTLVEKMIHDGSEIERRTGSGAIPAMVTPEDWPLSDSTPIARLLNDRYPDRPVLPSSPVQRVGVLLLEDWFDEWFMRVAMYTRWNFPESVEALVGSGASSRVFGKPWHQLTEQERLSLQGPVEDSLERIASFRQRMTTEVARAYGTTLEQGKDIMVWYGEFLDAMAQHLTSYEFLLGDRPCVADFVISGGFAAHFGNDTWPRNFVYERQPSVLAYAERCWAASSTAAKWLPDDVLPDTWQPFFSAMQDHYLRYLVANRAALASGEDTVSVDFGFGYVATPPRVYQELSRLDVRDEILRFSATDQERIRAVIPAGVLDVYMLPAVKNLPGLSGNKDTFPDPKGLGVLDG